MLPPFSFQFLPPGGSIGLQMAYSFYFAKNYKIANNSATTEAKEKNKHRINSLEFFEKC
jgi:hypothetical protein